MEKCLSLITVSSMQKRLYQYFKLNTEQKYNQTLAKPIRRFLK